MDINLTYSQVVYKQIVDYQIPAYNLFAIEHKYKSDYTDRYTLASLDMFGRAVWNKALVSIIR